MSPLPAEMLGTRRVVRGLVRSARPKQWTKNLFLFAGLIFADKLADGGAWASASAAFVAFCAASSAAYLVNDVRDVPHDRLHPVKRLRPVASGEISPALALVTAVSLAATGLSVAGAIGRSTLLLLLGFLFLQVAYSFVLKRVALIDVLAIAGLFVIRAAAGAEAVQVLISPWLLLCTALLALFLGLVKRRAELVFVGAGRTAARPVLRQYGMTVVECLVWLAAIATVTAYTVYAVTVRDSPAMTATVPFAALGLARYLFLMHRRNLGEAPDDVLLADRTIVLSLVCWLSIAIAAVRIS